MIAKMISKFRAKASRACALTAATLLALGCAIVATPAHAQITPGLPGTQLLSAMPSVIAGGGVTNWVIGTTNASISPVDLSNARNITWEVTGACTNTTSIVTIVFALFSDMERTNWYNVASNCTQVATRVWTIPLTTVNGTFSTNFDVGAYRYMVPLYATNASQMWTNATLRYAIKPGY